MEINTTSYSEKGPLFWIFLGPASLILSLSLLILKAPLAFPLAPVVAACGIALTWRYRLKGLFASLALLFSLGLYQVVYHDALDSVWFVGSLFTFAFSLLITFLTLEEAVESISESRDDQVHEIKETRVDVESVFQAEKQGYLTQIQVLEEKQISLELEYANLGKLQEISRIELLSIFAKHESLVSEIFALNQSKKKLEETVEDITQDKILLTQAQEEVVEKWQLERSKGEEMSHLIDQLTREKDLFESTLSNIQAELEEKEKSLSHLKHELEIEKNQASVIVPELIDLTPFLNTPPVSESEYRRLYGMHKQLREQFEAKSAELDLARRDLFLAKEQAGLLEIQLKELELKELEVKDSLGLKTLTEELEATSLKYDEALQEISSLEAFISNLMSQSA